MPYTSRYALVQIAILVSSASACGTDRGHPAGFGAMGDAGAMNNGSPQTSADAEPGLAAIDAAVPDDAAAVSEPRSDAATVSEPRSDAADADAALQDAGSERLVELTEAELDALCRWAEGLHITPSKVQLCTSRGLQATSQAACTAKVAACVASGDVDASARPQCDASFVRKLPKHCAPLSVEDYRRCAEAAADAANRRLASVSCAQLESPAPAGAGGELPACEVLVRVCPELAPEGSGAASTWSGGSFVCDDGWPLFMNEVCNGTPECIGGEDEKSCEKK